MKIAQDPEQFHVDFIESQKRFAADVDLSQSKAEAEKLRSFVLSGEYEIEQKSVGFNLGMMFQSLFDVAEELTSFGFHILLAPNTPASTAPSSRLPETTAFVTCDNPVFTIRPESDGTAAAGIGFGRPGTEVYMPLNKRCCLRLAKDLSLLTLGFGNSS
jgi:hypothetical protein